MRPVADIVSKPLTDLCSSTSKSRTGDDHRAYAGCPRDESIVRLNTHHRTKEIVRIVFSDASIMYDIGIRSTVAETLG